MTLWNVLGLIAIAASLALIFRELRFPVAAWSILPIVTLGLLCNPVRDTGRLRSVERSALAATHPGLGRGPTRPEPAGCLLGGHGGYLEALPPLFPVLSRHTPALEGRHRLHFVAACLEPRHSRGAGVGCVSRLFPSCPADAEGIPGLLGQCLDRGILDEELLDRRLPFWPEYRARGLRASPGSGGNCRVVCAHPGDDVLVHRSISICFSHQAKMRRSLLRLVDGRNALDHAGLLGTLPALARAASGTCLGRAGPVEPSEVRLSGPDRGGLGGAERTVAGVRA